MIRWLSINLLAIAILIVDTDVSIASPESVDGYMIEAHYTQYNEQGQIYSRFYSPQVNHFIQDNTSYFKHPEMIAYNEQRIPWTVHATEGKAIHDGQQVDLMGNVKIYQAPQPHHSEITILTESLTVYPPRSYAKTDQEITIIRPDTHIQAIGMEAYFKQGIFKLISAVKGTYVPPPSTNQPR